MHCNKLSLIYYFVTLQILLNSGPSSNFRKAKARLCGHTLCTALMDVLITIMQFKLYNLHIFIVIRHLKNKTTPGSENRDLI